MRDSWRLYGTCTGLLALLLLAGCTQPAADTPAPNAPPSTVHPNLWPQVPQPRFDDRALEQRLATLMSALTLEEKIGQIIQADVTALTPEDVRQYHLGSVLSGGNSPPGLGTNDLAPAQAWLAAADGFYLASMDTSDGGQAVPVFWGVDAVHGHNNIIGATLFPHNIALGATRNPDLMSRIGAVTALELRVTGQEWTFAPTVAVVQDVRWGRSYESYAEDPALVRDYAKAIVQGLQGKVGAADFLRGAHVIATAKHYIGDGGTFEGRDQGDTLAAEQQLRDIHGAGYPAAISAGVQAVMASFSSWQGRKVHGHHGLISDALKTRMGFQGLVVGDWEAHGQVEGCTTTSCATAINAGLDMFMAPGSWKELYTNTLAQVRSGEIPQARLDDAVRRILRVKLRAGLFEAGKPSSRPYAGRYELLGAPEHRAVARQAVRESLVLLKNDGGLLPLRPNRTILVAGDGADNLAKQNGGWTLTWQGTGIDNSHFPKAESIFSAMSKAVTAGGGKLSLSVDGSYTSKPEVAIVVFGEEPYAEFQGDVQTLEYQPGSKRDLALLRKLKEDGIAVVAVFLSGRPLWVNPELNAADAFVAAWLPGSEGGGIADVLFAKPNGAVNYDFKGKLPVAWPRTPLQTTANPGKEPPLFAYGFGLSYRDRSTLPRLPEDVPGLSTADRATRVYFSAGKPAAGWQLAVRESSGARVALSAGVGASTSGALRVTAVDHAAQEDARLATWSGATAATLIIDGTMPIDLQRETNGQMSLAFDYRVDQAPGAAVGLAIECGSACRAEMPIEAQLRKAPQGEWREMKVMLQCFQKNGADLRSVTAPFALTSSGPLQLRIANVRLASGLNDTVGCN
jgi:beta-glucosidase